VIFPGALGDLICALPALRTLARRHPGASLELMARAELARFAVGRLGAVHGHSIDRREMGQLFLPPEMAGLDPLRAFFGGFSHTYSFFAADNANLRASLTLVAGGPVVFIPFRPSGDDHMAALYLREVEQPTEAFDRDSLANNRIAVLQEDLASARTVLDKLGLQPRDFLLILPGSGSPAKNWPAEHFAALAAILSSQGPSMVLIGPAEAAMAPFFREHRLPVAQALDLGTVAGLACLAKGFVGNDSGVAHLAAAAGAAGVAIFGPSDPAQWCPLGRVEVIRREPLSLLDPRDVATLIQLHFEGIAGSVLTS